MYCSQCGNQVDGGTNFCPVCGRETTQPKSGGRIDSQFPAPGMNKTKATRPSGKRLGVLVGGIGVLAAAVVAVVLVTTSSQPTLFPTGSGTGNVTWSGGGGGGGGEYNVPVQVGGAVQGLSINATATPENNGQSRGSITGTIGGKSFAASLTGYEGNQSGESIVGTYAGMPLTGTAYTDSTGEKYPVTIKGTIEGQPVRGTLTAISPEGNQSFTFSGTIGNLKVSGTAATLSSGFTSTQQVG
jgi:hypothetical protein